MSMPWLTKRVKSESSQPVRAHKWALYFRSAQFCLKSEILCPHVKELLWMNTHRWELLPCFCKSGSDHTQKQSTSFFSESPVAPSFTPLPVPGGEPSEKKQGWNDIDHLHKPTPVFLMLSPELFLFRSSSRQLFFYLSYKQEAQETNSTIPHQTDTAQLTALWKSSVLHLTGLRTSPCHFHLHSLKWMLHKLYEIVVKPKSGYYDLFCSVSCLHQVKLNY